LFLKFCKAAMRVSLAGKTSQDFSSSALFSCHDVWFAHVRSVVNNISKYQTPIDSSTLWRYVTIMSSESTEILSNYFTHAKIKTNSTQFARTTACQILTNFSNNFTQQWLVYELQRKFFISQRA